MEERLVSGWYHAGVDRGVRGDERPGARVQSLGNMAICIREPSDPRRHDLRAGDQATGELLDVRLRVELRHTRAQCALEQLLGFTVQDPQTIAKDERLFGRVVV